MGICYFRPTQLEINVKVAASCRPTSAPRSKTLAGGLTNAREFGSLRTPLEVEQHRHDPDQGIPKKAVRLEEGVWDAHRSVGLRQHPEQGRQADTVDRQGPRQDGENPPLKALRRLMQTQISSPRWSATRMRTRNSAMTAPISTPHTSSCDWRARPLLLELQADAELTRKGSESFRLRGPGERRRQPRSGAATRQRGRDADERQNDLRLERAAYSQVSRFKGFCLVLNL